MSRPLTFVIALVACGVIAGVTWTLLHAGDGAGTSAPAPPKELTDAAPPAPPPASESRTEKPRVEPIAPKRFSEAEPSAGTPPASRPARRGRKLYVVLAPGDVPAAGATVEFAPIDSKSFDIEEAQRAFDPLDYGQAVQATKLVADENGVVELPKFKSGALVRGRSGDLIGGAMIFGGMPGRATLKLSPPLRVLVVNAGGAPQAGVPIDLSPSFFGRNRGITKADGVADLMVPDEQASAVATSNEQFKLRVLIALPLPEPVQQIIDPAKLPSTPIKLTLPDTGRVTVRLVRPDGKPFEDPATVTLRAGGEREILQLDGFSDGSVSAAAVRGVASFPVGLGVKVSALATPADQRLRVAEGALDGPKAAGEEATLELVCGRPAVVISGRLVDGRGQALAGAEFDPSLPGNEVEIGQLRIMKSRTHKTDGEGRFKLHFDVDPASLADDAMLVLSVRIDATFAGMLGGRAVKHREVTVPLPASVRRDTVDLGDVVLEDLASVAAGRVVTTEGAPLGEAKVNVFTCDGRPCRRLSDLESVADPLGRFEVKGKTDNRDLQLIARLDGWVCVNPTSFNPGGRDLKVVMTKAGGIEGSILKKEGVDLSGSVTVLVGGPEARIAARNAGSWRRNDGRFEVGYSDGMFTPLGTGKFKTRELVPGTYSVEVIATDTDAPLFSVDGIVVVAGQVNRDPRLQNIEINQIASRTVTVIDEQSKPVENAWVGCSTAKENWSEFTRSGTGSDGKAVLTTSKATVDVVVAKKGYRAVTVPNVSGDVTVTLQKSTPRSVTIKLDPSTELPPSPSYFSVDLVWLCPVGQIPPEEGAGGDPRNPETSDRLRFDANRSLTLTVDNPGIYRVQLWLMKDARGNLGAGITQKDNQAATVTVSENGPASVTVTPDPEDLKRSIEDLKGR